MTRERLAFEIVEGVNWAGEFPAFCSWSGCERPPSFVVAHPVLKWVPTCLECVEGGQCGTVRKVSPLEEVEGFGL